MTAPVAVSAAPPHPARTRSPWLTLVAMCLGFFLMLLDSTIVAVAVPSIAADFEVTDAATVWVNSGYLFAYAVPLLCSGRWGDRFGPRRVYIVGLGVFVAASLACGLAPTLEVLVAARIAQGAGAALMTPQSLAMIRRVFPAASLPTALGIWSAVGGVAAASGPLLGGVLISWAGWPAIFLVNVPLGVVALAMVVWWAPRLPAAGGTVPVVTAAGSAVGVFALVFAVHEAPHTVGWLTIVVAAAGVVLTVLAFVFQPRDPRRALVPGLLVRSRGFVAAVSSATSASFIVGAALIPVMLHLQNERGLDVGTATLVVLPLGVVSAVTAPLAGLCVRRWGARPVAVTGSAAMVVSICACAVAADTGAPISVLVLALGLFGFANSFVWSPLATAAMTSVPVEFAGAASGTYNATRQVGAVLGSAVTAMLLAVSGPVMALGVLGLSGFVAVAGAAFLPKGVAAAQARPSA